MYQSSHVYTESAEYTKPSASTSAEYTKPFYTTHLYSFFAVFLRHFIDCLLSYDKETNKRIADSEVTVICGLHNLRVTYTVLYHLTVVMYRIFP